LVIGSGTGAVTSLAVGGAGTILTGVVGANPAWTTATYPATATQGDLICASAANTFTSLSAGTTDYVLTANGAGAAPTWQAAGGASGVTVKNETGTTYTFILTDAEKHITFTNASAVTVTVPANASVAFPIGTVISFSQGGAGQVSFTGATPPTLQSADAALTTVKLYSGGSMIKILEDTWRIFGDMEA